MFCSTNYDENYDRNGIVYLFDELEPREMTRYILERNHFDAEDEIVYAFVCRTHMKIINAFYKEIKSGSISYTFSRRILPKNTKKYKEKYLGRVMKRMELPLKRLRGI